MPTEVIPTNPHYDDDYGGPPPPIRHPDSEAQLDELARAQGVKPVHDIDSMPRLFDEGDLDEFDRWLRKVRGRDCECP